MENKVNPSMLILARESRGLTQTELARQLGIKQGSLSKMEQGLSNVSDNTLNDLTCILQYPEPFFLQSGQIYGGISYHRKRQSLTQKQSDKIDSNANIRSLHLKKLLKAADIPFTKVPFHDIESEPYSPQEIARFVRSAWGLPKGPINNLTAVLEKAGIIIIPFNFETKLIDGLSVFFNDLPPVIFINENISGDRLRFTLAHELGHIVMHKYPTETMEEEADSFASEFLMPAKEIEPYLGNLSIERLVDLKRYWKASMAAILVSAKRLGRITQNQYQYLWVTMSKNGFRTNEPAPIPMEKAKLVQQLIDLHLDELGYSAEQLAELLCLSQTEMRILYLNHRPDPSRGLRFIPGTSLN